MGAILDCACIYCEYYQDEIYLGSGAIPGQHSFPALHTVKKKIVGIDIFKYLEIEDSKLPENDNEELKGFRSKKKLPYFEKEMFEENLFENEILSDFPRLQSKYNYCPQCEKYGLQFSFWGLFD